MKIEHRISEGSEKNSKPGRANREYAFYGWRDAGMIKAKTDDYPGIETPTDLYDALSELWCAKTCAPRMRPQWTAENKTLGQCSITAFLVQDVFGGEVYGMITEEGGIHCYNDVDGILFDLTCEQFGSRAKELQYLPDYDSAGQTGNAKRNQLQERESAAHFFKEEKRQRYEYLKAQLGTYCKEKR